MLTHVILVDFKSDLHAWNSGVKWGRQARSKGGSGVLKNHPLGKRSTDLVHKSKISVAKPISYVQFTKYH